MTIQAVSWVLDHSESQAIDRLVLIAMANNEDGNGFCGVSKATLAHEAGRISESTVWRSQSKLAQLGEIAAVDVRNAPSWWLEIDERRRPRLWRLVAYLASRNAMAAHVRGRAGVAQGSRSCATRPSSPSSPTDASRSETPGLTNAPAYRDWHDNATEPEITPV